MSNGRTLGGLSLGEAAEFFMDLFQSASKPPGEVSGDFDLMQPDPMGLCRMGYTDRLHSELMAIGSPGPAVASQMPLMFISADWARVFPEFYTMAHMEQISFNSAQDRIGAFKPQRGGYLWYDQFEFPTPVIPPNLYGGRVPTVIRQAYCGYEQPFRDENGQISYVFASATDGGKVFLAARRTHIFTPKHAAEYAKNRAQKRLQALTGNPNPGGIDFSPLPQEMQG